MNEEIAKILNEFVSISSEEVEVLTKKWSLKKFNRQENFIEINKPNNLIGFLKKGLLRSYFYDENGDEQTTAFIQQGSFFSDLKSYQTNTPSERNIEALETSEIYILSNNDLVQLRSSIPNLQQFEIKYFEKILKEKIEFQRSLTTLSKKEALKIFIKAYPQAAKFAPRQYIASFLGMTPYTLSRIKL